MPWQAHQRHAWASQHQVDSGTYLVPTQSYTDTNYHKEIITRLTGQEHWHVPVEVDPASFDFSWHPNFCDPLYIYRFGTQWQPTGGPEYRMPGAVDVKYVAFPKVNKVSVDEHWHFPTVGEFAEFDLTWHPDSRDPPYIYQFGTQHQKTGGPQYRVPGAVDTKYVDQIRFSAITVASAVYEIDHMDGHAGKIPNSTKSSRYFDNYLDTLRRLVKSISPEHEFVWVCSSICDYSNFDFTWHPEQWQAGMLHVFASDDQKFGDTFYLHVPSFLEKTKNLKMLEWFDTLHFVENITVPRWPIEKVQFNDDSLVDAVHQHKFAQPVVEFYRYPTTTSLVPTINLWQPMTKTIVSLSQDGSHALVPRECKSYLTQQIYDYPYISKDRSSTQAQLQDIIYISYDEPEAEENWIKLSQQFPNARRVHGVAGMENALQAAAKLSSTPWYFAVFAKTKLSEHFDFTFVPDYFQQPKHYIFDCKNKVNDLVYGHMAVVMYNCALINTAQSYNELGLDYTMSFPHQVVPILSCYGEFNRTAYHTWRTAFREASKLAYFLSCNNDVDSEYRLKIWTTQAHGDHSEWCLRGANDGVEFFKSSQGDLAYMKQSFRWEWLRDYFVTHYGDLE